MKRKSQDESDLRSSSSSKHVRSTTTTVPVLFPSSFYCSTIQGVIDDPGVSLSIQDIFSGGYQRVLLTNYLIDHAWLIQQVPQLQQVPVLCIEDHRNLHRFESLPPNNFQIHSPPMGPSSYGVHHAKMAILLYEQGIRVAIFTNNFIEQDWRYKSNGIFVQDFPRRKESSQLNPEIKQWHQFGPVLAHYLSKLDGPAIEFSQLISQYDYSNARCALVPSIPGKHRGRALNMYGHMRLRYLQNYFKRKSGQGRTGEGGVKEEVRLCAQVSSFGSISEKFLKEFKMSMLGATALKDAAAARINLSIAWPSQILVRESNQGYQAGHSLCMPLKNCKSFLFGVGSGATQQQLPYLEKWRPVLPRGFGMPHIKTYCGGPTLCATGTHSVVPWLVLTSANMSSAAWGSLQAYRKSGQKQQQQQQPQPQPQQQLDILHYEMGVLLRPEFCNNKILFSLTPEHPTLGFCNGTRMPDECSFLLTMSRDVVGTKLGSLLTPIPHKITGDPDFFVLRASEQPWRWSTAFDGLDAFGQICDGSFEKNVKKKTEEKSSNPDETGKG